MKVLRTQLTLAVGHGSAISISGGRSSGLVVAIITGSRNGEVIRHSVRLGPDFSMINHTRHSLGTPSWISTVDPDELSPGSAPARVDWNEVGIPPPDPHEEN